MILKLMLLHIVRHRSSIVNDPNTTAVNIPSLLKRVVTVSLESVAIVQALPNIS